MNTTIKNILRTYLHRLTNLTGNNRSLLLMRLPAEQMVDLHEFNFLMEENSFDVIRALMVGKTQKLCRLLDSRVEANNDLSRKLKKLQRSDQLIYEERGSKDLHVGWPFVRGKLADGTLVRAPLLFFPVSLVQGHQDWIIQPREDAGIVLNKSFLLAYSFYNKVELSEELIEASFDDFNHDHTVWRVELYQLLKDKIELNFNPDNFRDELAPFEIFNKKDFEEKHRNGEIKLYPEAVLGIFPQADSQLITDYSFLMEQDGFDDLEDFFITRNAPVVIDGDEVPFKEPAEIKEEKLFTPFSLDAWQENAIRAVKTGKSIVVQGPPGTGKSQLIGNLLADAIASGKRALLVCQKRAALDVVFKRLNDIQLGNFLGLVHDFRNDRKDIFEKLARQIDKIDDYQVRNRSVDIIQMERRFFQVCRRIDQIVEELDEFREILYDTKECGLAVKELYLNSDPYAEGINVKQEFQYLTFPAYDAFLRQVRRYALYADRFERDEYLWRMRHSFASLNMTDMKEMVRTITEIPVVQNTIADAVEKIAGVRLNLEEGEAMLGREDDILGMLSVLKDEQTYRYFQVMMLEPDEETSMLWLANVERVFMNCYEDRGPEVTLPSAQLGKLQLALKQRMDARTNLIRMIRWELFSENKPWLKRVLEVNDLEYKKEGFRGMEEKLDSRLNLEHHLTSLKSKAWLLDLPASYDLKEFKAWFERQKYAVRAKLIFNSIREVKRNINPQKLTRQEFSQCFHNLLSAVEGIPMKKFEWLNYLSPHQIRRIVLEPNQADDFASVLKRDFEDLCSFDSLKENLQQYEYSVITKLYDHVGAWNFEALEPVLKNSLTIAWIEYIETKYPVLRMASSLKMEDLETDLQQHVKEKRELSQQILLMRAQERVYDNIEYNRLRNRITYRDLYHQVTKKKKLWPLRKVISEYYEDIFRLMPCWMASPEAVSAIFPMEPLFDLVIFDEASQCFAERGIPAMYRGQQVLIAGDSMQLKPHELYQVRWYEEGEHPDQEVDSLLDLAERYLPGEHLQGHYRSQSSELIDFSNKHFYEGRLRLLPDRHSMNNQQPAIQYVKVDGVWEQYTNEKEAEAVVACVFNLMEQSPEKEIGVVTFNAPQQMLIMDKLEERALETSQKLPASLFVKNIENVQGDEKDVIIFSIGYAPDKKGKMGMQFGTLNMKGGENRLNVAITRARQQIIMVSSIWPEQLRTEESKNEGPKLLKEYLTFARHVHEGKFMPTLQASDAQSSSWYLKKRLKAWGEKTFEGLTFDINTLPFSDVCFRQGKHYLGVILTDDERYLQSLSIKDAHVYTMAHLTQKHWDHRMVYSRNLWLDRERFEDSLMRMVGALKIDEE